MYIVYILFSAVLNRFYIGYTGGCIQQRLQKHLSDHNGFTAKAKDWQIVHQQKFQTKELAMQREKQLKSWKSHQRISEFIQRSSAR